MKIVFAGGGTAGHVNPALAVAGYICKQEPGSQVFLSGGKGNIEEKLAAKAGELETAATNLKGGNSPFAKPFNSLFKSPIIKGNG